MAADNFTATSANSSGTAAGDYAWSNTANWSAGIPNQNTQANIAATSETLLIDGADVASQVTFGSSTTASMGMLILAGDSLSIGGGAVLSTGTTLTIAAASAGTLTTSGGTFEIKSGASLNMLGGSFVAQSGTLTVDTGATASFGAGVSFSVKSITLTGTATLNLSVGSQSAPTLVNSVNASSASSKLTETGGDLQIGLGGAGTYSVAGGGTIEFTNSLNNGGTIDLAGGLVQMDSNVSLASGTSFAFSGSTASTLDVVSSNNYQNGFGYSVSGFDHGDTLEFGTTALTSYVYTASNHTLSLTNANGTTFKVSSLFLASDVASQPGFVLNGNSVQLACFLSGTMIETADGPVPVQDLRVGAAIVTIQGGRRVLRPARWIGSRRIQAASAADESEAYPVRICAGAIAPGVPRRDLLVTGEHGIHIAAGLIPARMLVNGRSILRDTRFAHYRVYHVEFDSHAIMLAEGLEAESYLDTGNRASFDRPGTPRTRDTPLSWGTNAAARLSWSTDAAAPLTTARETVEPIWRTLDRRCDALGLARACMPLLSNDPALEILLEDGRLLRARWQRQGRHFFHVPCGARPIRLLSNAVRPSDAIGAFVDDRRLLGVAVQEITHWDGLTDRVLQAADLTGDGWHGVETGAAGFCRWTDGRAALPMQMARGDDCFLEVRVAAVMQYPRRVKDPERQAA